MKRVELADLGDATTRYAHEAEGEPVILTDHGRPVAAIVRLGDVDWETISLSTNPAFLDLVQRSRSDVREHGGTPFDEMLSTFGLTHDDLDQIQSELPDDVQPE